MNYHQKLRRCVCKQLPHSEIIFTLEISIPPGASILQPLFSKNDLYLDFEDFFLTKVCKCHCGVYLDFEHRLLCLFLIFIWIGLCNRYYVEQNCSYVEQLFICWIVHYVEHNCSTILFNIFIKFIPIFFVAFV